MVLCAITVLKDFKDLVPNATKSSTKISILQDFSFNTGFGHIYTTLNSSHELLKLESKPLNINLVNVLKVKKSKN